MISSNLFGETLNRLFVKYCVCLMVLHQGSLLCLELPPAICCGTPPSDYYRRLTEDTRRSRAHLPAIGAPREDGVGLRPTSEDLRVEDGPTSAPKTDRREAKCRGSDSTRKQGRRTTAAPKTSRTHRHGLLLKEGVEEEKMLSRKGSTNVKLPCAPRNILRK